MNVGTLFSGIGGFDLAFQRAGIEPVWSCEIDPKARNILARHFPGVPIMEDVKYVGRNTVAAVDVICGGFPCQDLSVAGKRAGLAGERSGLWFEFARIIDELEPRWVVIENVPGLLSSNRGQDFAVIIQWLAKRGYGVAWRVLDAQYFGVPQRRRRVFVVASFGNGRSAEILFEREGVRWNNPESGKTGKEIAGTIDRKSCDSCRGSQANEIDFCIPINTMAATRPESASQNRQTFGVGNNGDPIFTLQENHSHAVAFGVCRNEADNLISGTVSSKWSKGAGGPAGDECQNLVSALTTNAYADRASEENNLVCWEMQHASEAYRESGSIPPTLQARMGTGGNNVPMVGVRRLMPIECERLQGFPDNWTDGQSDSTRYKQCGNAVAVPVVEWIARRIALVDILP